MLNKELQIEEIIPSEISFEDHIFDLVFHPQNDLLACGLITGCIKL